MKSPVPRLLIIKLRDYFFHVPMGSFGVCDYLNQKNIEAKILNLACFI